MDRDSSLMKAKGGEGERGWRCAKDGEKETSAIMSKLKILIKNVK